MQAGIIALAFLSVRLSSSPSPASSGPPPPLVFERNEGRFERAVRFFAKTARYTLLLRADGAVLIDVGSVQGGRAGRIDLLHASCPAEIAGMDPLRRPSLRLTGD